MWDKLKGLALGNRGQVSEAGQRGPYAGSTTIAIETTREVLTAHRLERAFYAGLLGVRSAIDGVNPLERRVMKRVDRLSSKSGRLGGLVPPVPTVIPALMRALRDDSLSDDQLAAEIGRDAVLLGNVLRFANSSFCTTPESIRSIEHALQVMGRDGVLSLVARAVFRPLLNGYTDHFSKLAGPLLWQQAQRCALACEYIAGHSGVHLFDAYVAGLIHKVGYRVVARVLGEEYRGADAPRSVEFRDWLTERVPALSWRVSQEWGLPVSVADSLKGLARAGDRSEFASISGVVFASARLSEFLVLSREGRIKGDIKRFSCRINGAFAEYCSDCYAQMSSLDVPA
jgi:HD-like signal output (HDOD) protein